MKKHFIDNNSDTLLIFFSGWGCDEHEFAHLKASSDILILYNYSDMNLDFDFSKYKKINLLAFSAGVFAASIMNFEFEIDKKIAISGNPYLFDEKLGLSEKIQNVLYNVTEETADDFARNYLVKTDEEWKRFQNSNRTPESCREEFDSLKQIYKSQKSKIQDIYDIAYFGEYDTIFNISEQEKFYKNRIHVLKNASHNLFFRILADNARNFL